MLTFRDSIDEMVDWLGGNTLATVQRNVRAACLAAYRHLIDSRDWSYLYRQGRVRLQEPYTTGTVEYDHCVTDEHEALTKSGWKKRSDIAIGEMILAYDHDTGMSRWEPVQHIHQSAYSGRLMEVRRKGRVILRCTENHRFPCFSRRESRTLGRRSVNVGFVKARDITPEHSVPLIAQMEFDNDESALSPRLAAILGWAITDGTGLLDKDRGYGASIAQSVSVNPDKCASIQELTGTRRRGPYRRNGSASWLISPSDIKEIKRVITSKNELPSLVTRLSRDAAQAMYDAMMAADGHAGSQAVFSQWRHKRKPIVEAFQILCLMLGKTGNITERNYKIGGLRSTVAIRRSRSFKPSKASSWVHYDGEVWCPQVKSGAWFCRYRGAVTITGNSGGAYERMLTLTTGTWPDWTLYGKVRIDDVVYEIEDVKSSSIVTLDASICPGEDIASGETFTLFRNQYTLPADFKNAGSFYPETSRWQATYVVPEDWLSLERYSGGTEGAPVWYTILPDRNLIGAWAIAMYPAPDSSESLDYIYRSTGRDMKFTGHDASDYAGTVSVTDGSATLTGSGTAFSADMIGAAVRVSVNNTAVPTGVEGMNPYAIERTLTAVASATSATMDVAADQTLSAKKYVISDPVDIERGMINAYLACCRWQYAIRKDSKRVSETKALYEDAHSEASGADQRTTEVRYSGDGRGGYSRRLRDMPGPAQLGWED